MKKTTAKLKTLSAAIALIFLSAVFCFAFSGCAEEKLSLYVITMFGGTDAHAPVYQAVNREFEEAYGGVEVSDNSSGSNNIWQINVRNSFMSESTMPDVLFYFNNSAADSLRSNLVSVKEIKEYDSAYGEDIGITISDPHCLPVKGFTEGIIYNKSVYSENDFAHYETMRAKILQNKEKDGTRVSAGNDIPHYWINYLLALKLGSEEFAAFDGSKGFFDENGRKGKWTDALDWAINEMKTMGIALEGEEANASKYFFEGNRGLLVDGSWVAGKIMESAVIEKLEVTGFPCMSGGNDKFILSGFTSGWFITKKAWKDPDKRRAAVDFVKMHTTRKNIGRYCSEAGGIPATGNEVPDASEAANKFAALLSDGVVSLLPLDDRMTDNAKLDFYGTNGVPMLLREDNTISITAFFNSFYSQLT